MRLSRILPERKALVELDGRPAADVYNNELGVARSQIVDNVLVNPMGRAVGDQVFISSMMSLEPNGTLTSFKRINKNDCIYRYVLYDKEGYMSTYAKDMASLGAHMGIVGGGVWDKEDKCRRECDREENAGEGTDQAVSGRPFLSQQLCDGQEGSAGGGGAENDPGDR